LIRCSPVQLRSRLMLQYMYSGATICICVLASSGLKPKLLPLAHLQDVYVTEAVSKVP